MRVEQYDDRASHETVITLTLTDADLVALPSEAVWWAKANWDSMIDTLTEGVAVETGDGDA